MKDKKMKNNLSGKRTEVESRQHTFLFKNSQTIGSGIVFHHRTQLCNDSTVPISIRMHSIC